jgi:dTDP-4-dehydrorhamnose 3,5-epimerase-like enzyme
MNNKIQIISLPITDTFTQQRRLIQDRGELALIEDGMPFRHLGYFSLRSGKGFFRGGHYHLRKTEFFYVIAGTLRIQLVDLDTGERSATVVRTGQRVTIEPRCAHRFQAEQEAHVIEYYDGVYDRDDDHPYHDF